MFRSTISYVLCCTVFFEKFRLRHEAAMQSSLLYFEGTESKVNTPLVISLARVILFRQNLLRTPFNCTTTVRNVP
jgi:hypothetical protein